MLYYYHLCDLLVFLPAGAVSVGQAEETSPAGERRAGGRDGQQQLWKVSTVAPQTYHAPHALHGHFMLVYGRELH